MSNVNSNDWVTASPKTTGFTHTHTIHASSRRWFTHVHPHFFSDLSSLSIVLFWDFSRSFDLRGLVFPVRMVWQSGRSFLKTTINEDPSAQARFQPSQYGFLKHLKTRFLNHFKKKGSLKPMLSMMQIQHHRIKQAVSMLSSTGMMLDQGSSALEETCSSTFHSHGMIEIIFKKKLIEYRVF